MQRRKSSKILDNMFLGNTRAGAIVNKLVGKTPGNERSGSIQIDRSPSAMPPLSNEGSGTVNN